MLKRYCDICGKEINKWYEHEFMDSDMQYYTLMRNYGSNEHEIDICNDCLHKVVDFVNGDCRPKSEWKALHWQGVSERDIRLMFPYKCDNCDKEIRVERIDDYNYCPNCGADMREEE